VNIIAKTEVVRFEIDMTALEIGQMVWFLDQSVRRYSHADWKHLRSPAQQLLDILKELEKTRTRERSVFCEQT